MKEELIKIFPSRLRAGLANMDWQEKALEEIRIRIGQKIEFCYGEEDTFYDEVIKEEDLNEMLTFISRYSIYAFEEEMRQGFLTIEGGHRIGLCGQVRQARGEVERLANVRFLNIRVAKEKPGCADPVMDYIRNENGIYNTFFLSPPGVGKTTCLRDCIRQLSKGSALWAGLKVCVIDERSEIGAGRLGIPQNNLGPRTDVLDGCNKAQGMLMALRSMSPQVIAVDELGGTEDFLAVEQALTSGSHILGTLHAGQVRELLKKPYFKSLWNQKLIGRYIVIKKKKNGERQFEIFDENMEQIC